MIDLGPHRRRLKTPLWKHQDGALSYLEQNEYALLDLFMGTGKTKVLIDFLGEFEQPRAFCICPRKVVPVWRRNYEKHGGYEIVVAYMEKKSWGTPRLVEHFWEKSKEARQKRCGILIVLNYERAIQKVMKAFLLDIVWDLGILDESHRIKAPDGTTSKFVSTLFGKTKRRACLTGTPMPHTPLDIFGQSRYLHPKFFGTSFVRFRNAYAIMGVKVDPTWPERHRSLLLEMDAKKRAPCVQLLSTKKFRNKYRESLRDRLLAWLEFPLNEPSPFTLDEWKKLEGMNTKAMHQIIEYKNLEKFERILASFTYHVGPEVLDLPKFHHVTRPVKLEEEARRIYDEMQKDLVADVLDCTVTAANGLDRLLKLQQITSGHIREEGELVSTQVSEAKKEDLIDLFTDLHPKEPIVVFCLFVPDLKIVHEAAAATGRASVEVSGARDDVGDYWEPKDETVLAAQIQAGSEGVDYSNSRYAAYYSLGWSLGQYEQSLSRLWRPGQERSVIYFHIVAEKTIDEAKYRALRKRKEPIAEIIEHLRQIQDGNSKGEVA